MRLACYVSAGSNQDWGCYAALDLDAAAAAELLAWRTVYTAAREAALAVATPFPPDVSDVRIFDYRVDFYREAGEEEESFTDDEWVLFDADLTEHAKTDADVAVFWPEGVWWRAYVGDAALETPMITWAQLEAVARGEDPFAKTEETA